MRIRPSLSRVIPVVLGLATVMVSAQTGQDQQPTFQARTDFFTSHVYARNNRGAFVPDLRSEEFRVFEDGVEQRITLFQPVIGGRVIQTDVPGATPAPIMESLILPSAAPPADSSGRIFIIFIDDMHLLALDSPRVRQVLAEIRDTLIHEGDLVALVSTGYSAIATDLTYDYGHRRFNEAIEKVMGSGLTTEEILDSPNMSEGPAKVRFNAHVAFSTAYDMLDQLAAVTNRRKSFIYVSNGYNFNPYTEGRYQRAKSKYALLAGEAACPEDANQDDMDIESRELCDNPFVRDGQQFSEGDLISEIARLTRAAVRSNVVFYTVDPRGLMAPEVGTEITYADWRDNMILTTSTLQILGEETGGFCICQTNDFGPGLERIDNETSDYYIIGYTSNNPDPTRLRREVEIRTSRPDVDLVYRNEYILERPTSD